MIVLTKNLFEVRMQYYQAPNAVAAPSTATPIVAGNRELMRRTFNALPNRGRDLNIAGKGQNPLLANPVDQKTFDTKFQQVAAANRNLNPAGVPVKSPVVTTVAPPKPVNNISGLDAAKIAVQKGMQTTKEVASKGAQAVSNFAGAHPMVTGVGLGAAGALGLRKLLSRKNKEE